MDHKHTLGAVEAFLNDVWEGESDFEDITCVLGYNELKFLLERAKSSATIIESSGRIMNDMEDEYKQLWEENKRLQKALEKIVNHHRETDSIDWGMKYHDVIEIAQNGLEGAGEQ